MSQVVKSLAHVGPDPSRRRKVCERIKVVGVAAVLRHEDCRLETAQQRRHHLVEAFEPWLVPGKREKREVRRRSAARPISAVLWKACPRKKIASALVQA